MCPTKSPRVDLPISLLRATIRCADVMLDFPLLAPSQDECQDTLRSQPYYVKVT
jgi:hypothetical protein